MRAAAVFPDTREIRLVDHPEPPLVSPGGVKIRMLEVGVCGTDKDICNFKLGSAPRGSEYFVLGHESLGEVMETGPEAAGLRPGDLVVGAVRHPCPLASCAPCRGGRQDFCASGDYAERGIKDLHGFMTEVVVEEARYLHAVPRELRDVAVLTEPLTIIEKPLLGLEAIRRYLPTERRRAVVVGAGPIGLLGAMALIDAGYETCVYSRSRPPNAKAALAAAIGAEYVSSEIEPADRFAARLGNIDVIYEAAGAAQPAFDLLRHLGANGVFIFTGVPAPGEPISMEIHAIVRNMIEKNQVILGTVNAGADAFAAAIRHLCVFARRWPTALRSLITGRFPIEDFQRPVMGAAGGIKSVIDFAA